MQAQPASDRMPLSTSDRALVSFAHARLSELFDASSIEDAVSQVETCAPRKAAELARVLRGLAQLVSSPALRSECRAAANRVAALHPVGAYAPAHAPWCAARSRFSLPILDARCGGRSR